LNITIYTDGAAKGNPGPGGYGTVLLSGQFRKELSDGFELTTNNRMELLAVIIGLEALKIENSTVTIYSDSKYVVDAVEKGWIWNWVKIRFKGKKNQDLWLRFLKIYPKRSTGGCSFDDAPITERQWLFSQPIIQPKVIQCKSLFLPTQTKTE
jgi:ribonuclease HI